MSILHRVRQHLSSRRVVYAYFLVACLMLGSGLGRGQLFLLDMPWPERIQLSSYVSNGVQLHIPLLGVLWLLNSVVPAWLLQKFLLIGILFTAGYGMYALQRRLGMQTVYAFFGGLLYLLNPYPLDRLLAGQWLVLAGYSLLPVVATYVLAAYKKPAKKTIYAAVAVWLSYLFVSVHYWYMTTFLLAPYIVYVLVRHVRIKKLSKHASRSEIIAVLCFVTAILGTVTYYYLRRIAVYDEADFLAFATRALDDMGGFVTVLSLRGFWYSDGLVPASLLGLWICVSVCALLCCIYLATRLVRSRKHAAYYMTFCFVLVTLLAAGYAGNGSEAVVNVFRHIPGFHGLRETQKFVGFIAFAYAIAVPFAVHSIRIRKSARQSAVRIGMFTWFGVYMFVIMLTLFANQKILQPHTYPAEWGQVRTLVQAEDAPKKVLVVPWDGYVVLPFANGAYVANPARVYFGGEAFIRNNSDNMVLDEARGSSAVDIAALQLTQNDTGLTALKNAGFTHILVLHLQDYKSYLKTLNSSPSMQTYFSGTHLTLFEIR